MNIAAMSLHAQSTVKKDSKGDSKSSRAIRPGFDLPDSLYTSVDSIKGELDTIIYYSAKDSTVFEVDKKRMILTTDAKVDFRVQHIQAHRIIMDFTTSVMTAMSETADSALAASLGRRRRIIRDTARVTSRGAPKLIDGTTPYEGEVIAYNFKTKQGTVSLATSNLEGGFYSGEKIKQVEPKSLFVENGRYTTCDAPTPHFYFEAPKMKVLVGDQVLAEPVWLYIADVPVFLLPFGIFPNHQGGRRSGIIPPSYTTQSVRGFGLLHLGYYQVFSDYFDMGFRSDIYTRGGYNLTVFAQYMKRYLLRSPISLDLSYGRTRYSVDNPYSSDFRIGVNAPSVVIDPVTSLSANLSFQSNNYTINNAQNINDIVNQTANSRASFNTAFESLDLSFGAGYNRIQNLRDGTFNETSPSLSWGKITPIKPFASTSGTGESLLETFQITYSGSASRSVSKQKRISSVDTSYQVRESYSIRHSPGVSLSPRLGYITLSPSFGYGEQWFIRRKFKSPRLVINDLGGTQDTTVVIDEKIEHGLYREENYNYGLSFNTTLYGTANLNVLSLKAVRHTLQPSISLNYTPDLSANGRGEYIDPRSKRQVVYSIYEDDGGYIGSQRSGTISLGLGNNFEAKIERRVNDDSTYDDKIRLLNIGLGTGYDLIRKVYSPLSLNANSQIGTLFSLSGGAAFSWYPTNQYGSDSTDRTLLSLGQGFLRATNINFSLNGSFSSSETTDGENIDSLYKLFDISSPDDERALFLGGNYPGRFVHIPFRPKWNATYGLSYSESYFGSSISRNFTSTVSFSFSPTKNWSLSSYASYDFTAKKIVVPNLRIHRDLHCWELNFDYRPLGDIRGFNLEIRIKADQLKDIKISRQESSYGTF